MFSYCATCHGTSANDLACSTNEQAGSVGLLGCSATVPGLSDREEMVLDFDEPEIQIPGRLCRCVPRPS